MTNTEAHLAGSPHTYTVRSEFGNYPGYGQKTAQGQIHIIDPCMNPDQVVVGNNFSVDTDGYTQVIAQFPGF